MVNVSNKKILSLTLNELINISLDDTLVMLNNDLTEVDNYSSDYALSIASAIVKRIFLIKNFAHQYDKFYKIITSNEFRNNKYIYSALKDENTTLSDLLDVYDDAEELTSLIDAILMKNEKMFDELVYGQYNVRELFSLEFVNKFNHNSFKRILSFLLKDSDRKRVVKALFKNKNNKFIYMVSKMDDVVLQYSKDDTSYLDAVLVMLNYNNYRHLLWDYYNKYIGNIENENLMNSPEYRKEVPDELKELLNYTFALMDYKYLNDKVPEIISSIDELISSLNEGKDMVHTTVFGVSGYEKVKNESFDILFDFPKMDDENKLLNLKIAFFSNIYGITYDQAGKIIDNFDDFMKDFDGSFDKKDQLIYETVIAMKSLYDLKLDDKDGIDLYREVYYKYVKKNGLYAPVELSAAIMMEELMHRMYENSIEII